MTSPHPPDLSSLPWPAPRADPSSDPATHPAPTPPADPSFTADWRALDDPGDGARWSTWSDLEPLCRGPEPRPAWVVTSRAAVDTELGILKTGKEADVFLLERAVPGDPDRAVLLAAKRYRDPEHRSFHRSAVYTEGRRTRRSRDERALAKRSAYGRQVAAGHWAWAEWQALGRCWSAGVPVPYPVQIDGTELLMEYAGDSGGAAPRLAQTRPAPDLLADWFAQLRTAMMALGRLALAHGDLSPYNVLADGDRLVVIDLPQAVDLVANPQGFDLLLRDCATMCRWFRARGLPPEVADEHALFSEVLTQL